MTSVQAESERWWCVGKRAVARAGTACAAPRSNHRKPRTARTGRERPPAGGGARGSISRAGQAGPVPHRTFPSRHQPAPNSNPPAIGCVHAIQGRGHNVIGAARPLAIALADDGGRDGRNESDLRRDVERQYTTPSTSLLQGCLPPGQGQRSYLGAAQSCVCRARNTVQRDRAR